MSRSEEYSVLYDPNNPLSDLVLFSHGFEGRLVHVFFVLAHVVATYAWEAQLMWGVVGRADHGNGQGGVASEGSGVAEDGDGREGEVSVQIPLSFSYLGREMAD